MSDARTLQTGRYAIDHIRKPVTVYFHDDIIASTTRSGIQGIFDAADEWLAENP